MLAPGTLVGGKYRVLRVLGEGGMAVVYRAEHVEVGLQVAIKVMHRDFSTREVFLERFRREARAAAAIGHENIVNVLDFGTHDGQPFMVMEYLRGESLASRLDRERVMPVDLSCAIVGQVLMALSAAATAGIVHRDLKPENVFLTPRGANENFVKLLDFGISKFGTADAEGDKKGSVTRPGMVMGTPYYMSPEQAKAQPDVDVRADVYSAGVMLYEMLTGTRPFVADSEAEILAMICYRVRDPQPPRELNDSIPPELESAILRAIEHNREDRFQTAAEMLEAVRPFAAEALLTTPNVTGRFHVSEFPRATSTPASWSGSSTPSSPGARSRESLPTLTAEAKPRKPSRPRAIPIVVALLLTAGTALGLIALSHRHGETQPAAAAAPVAMPAPPPAAPTPPAPVVPVAPPVAPPVAAPAVVNTAAQPASRAAQRAARGSNATTTAAPARPRSRPAHGGGGFVSGTSEF